MQSSRKFPLTTAPVRPNLAFVAHHSTLVKWSLVSLGLLLFLGLMLLRQPLFPEPWFDEGLNVSTAATLARAGLYALPNSDGPRIMDPAIQTGPTVLVPIALVYHFFGVGIMPARLVMVAFALLAVVAYGLLARRLVGGAAALLALFFLLVGSRQEYAGFVTVGRQVLGEVPALGYYALGMLIWLRVVERPDRRWAGLVLSGLAWGIAMVTKSQILLIWPVSLGLLMLLDLFYYRRAGFLAFVVPGVVMVGCVAAWYAAQYAMAGPERWQENSAVLQEGFALHIVSLNPIHWRNAASVVWQTGWWLWGVPGIIWGLWQARQRTGNGFQHAVGLALPVIGTFWFVVLSVGWGRYAFYPIVLSSIWTAGLLVDLWRGRISFARLPGRRVVVGGMVALYLVANGGLLARNLIAPVDTGYLAMQRYLREAVPADAVIESWAWEMIAVPQPIHHPPTEVTNIITEYMWSRRAEPPADLYDVRQGDPQYILQNSFSMWTEIYHEILTDETQAELVVSFGNYALYALAPEQ
jgi:4-amino-4-deoxy-L-arabinose transferase-like glycosyltransferase